jgi:protein-S-isoprenylcysteine O-methyltransferase Ste14
MIAKFLSWLGRTPVQTFILCPLAVIGIELAHHGGGIIFVPSGLPVLVWGYLQYQLVGRYRIGQAGGGPGMATLPQRIVDEGPYRYTRNPMYLGHLIFMLGLALTFWSWFGLILLVARAAWFQHRVRGDEVRLAATFGPEYAAYRARVKRWVPGII